MTRPEIEAFLSICRHKNISKAAEELYISQSSLSTRLKMLEDHLGCSLLIRSKGKREITLTTQGQAFYDLALQYRNILDKMESVGKGGVVDQLRISVINSVGNYLMPPVFRRFTEKYPHIQLAVQDMEAEMACSSIIRGKTDMAFSTAKVQTDQIIATPFLDDPLVVLCSADSDYPDEVELEMLSVKDEVYVKWCVEHAYWHSVTFGSETMPQIDLELMGQIALFLSRPGKWTMAPQSVADCLRGPGIRQCKPLFSVPNRTVYILRHRDNAESNTIHYFLDTLREVLLEQETAGLLL